MRLISMLRLNENTTAEEIREVVAAGADVNGREDDDVFAAMDHLVPLHFAQNAEQTKALLDAGADPNAHTGEGRTPLHYAHGAEQAKLLLDAGADVNARDEEGATPLHYAQDAEQTRLLLTAGADPNVVLTFSGETPLHYAHDAAQTKVLLDAGADPNVCGKLGKTPLHKAKDPEQTRALLSAGAKVPDDLGDEQKKFVAMASAALRLASQPDFSTVGPTPTSEIATDADSDGWAAIRARRARDGGRSRC